MLKDKLIYWAAQAIVALCIASFGFGFARWRIADHCDKEGQFTVNAGTYQCQKVAGK